MTVAFAENTSMMPSANGKEAGGAPSPSSRPPNAEGTGSACESTSTRQTTGIWNVWKGDLHEGITSLAQAQEIFPYLFVQTTTLGTVARPAGLFRDSADHAYQQIRWNTDLLEVVQVAITVEQK